MANTPGPPGAKDSSGDLCGAALPCPSAHCLLPAAHPGPQQQPSSPAPVCLGERRPGRCVRAWGAIVEEEETFW